MGFSFLTHLEMLFINGLVIISIYLIWDSLCEHGVEKVMGLCMSPTGVPSMQDIEPWLLDGGGGGYSGIEAVE